MKKIFKVLLLVVLTFTCSQFVYSEGLETIDLNFLVETTKEINSTRNAAPQSVTDSGAYSIYIKKLKLRQDVLSKIAKNDPGLALKYVVKSDRRNKQPLKAQAYIEESKTINGIISVAHIDDFKDHDKSKYQYSVNNGKQKVEIYTAKDINAQSGARVSIKGYRLNQAEFLTEGDGNSIVIGEAPDIGALGKQRALVLLVNSKFDASELVTPKEIENYINNGSFQKFIKEASYGKTWFEAKAYGWITLNTGDIGNMCYGGGNSFDINTIEIQDYIRKQNINPGDFDRVIFLFPGGGGCSGVGKTNYNQDGASLSQSWVGLYKESFQQDIGKPFLWSYFDFVLTHEIGHALGLMHANGLDCDKQSFTGKCEHVEYGNNYDAMGAGGEYSLHFNGLYKEILGWIKVPNILFISKSGDYFLDNLESTSTLSKKFAKVYVPGISNSRPSVSLEHRADYGFDSKKSDTSPNTDNSGLLYSLPVFVNNNIDFASSRLIDLHPSNEYWYSDIADAGLRINDDPVKDESSGITLKILRQSKFGTNFNIKLDKPKCVKGLISDVVKHEIDSVVSVGGIIYPTLYGYNVDSILCDKSSLKLEAKLPDGWKISETSKKIFESVPGEIYYMYSEIEISDQAKKGTQIFELSILNTETGERSDPIEYEVEVIDRLIIDSVTPSIAEPGSQLVVSGSGFYKNKYSQSSVYVYDDNIGMYEVVNADITFNTIKFIFPKTFCKYTVEDKEDNCTVTTIEDGDYVIRINGYSNTFIDKKIQFLSNNSVIEEKSPYINSIINISAPNQKIVTLSPGDVLRISGVRFSTEIDSTIAFYASNLGCARKTACRVSSSHTVKSSDGKNIDFIIPNIFDDTYRIQVIDKKTGASNMVELIITKPKATSINTVNKLPSSNVTTPIQPKVAPTAITATTPTTVATPSTTPTPYVSPSPSVYVSPTASPTTTYTTPRINRISPSSGVAGTTVTIEGVNFEGVDAYTIFLRNNIGGEINPDNVVVTSTRITFKVPNITYGTYSVSLFGDKGDSNTVNFTITAPQTNTSSVFDWFLSFFKF